MLYFGRWKWVKYRFIINFLITLIGRFCVVIICDLIIRLFLASIKSFSEGSIRINVNFTRNFIHQKYPFYGLINNKKFNPPKEEHSDTAIHENIFLDIRSAFWLTKTQIRLKHHLRLPRNHVSAVWNQYRISYSSWYLHFPRRIRFLLATQWSYAFSRLW